MSEKCCSNCVFFSPPFVGDKGECRKYAPKVFVSLFETRTLFPSVFGTEWCGEHTLKKKEIGFGKGE